mgnify:CR=1 FL=1
MLIFALLVYCQTAGSAQTIQTISILGPKRTRIETVERELLFRVGEPFDSTRIEESARNLRRLPFLGRVKLTPYTVGSDIHVEVRVQDLHARALSPTVTGSIDALEYGLAALDYNLGGRGERILLAVASQTYVGKSAEVSFWKPRLFGSEHSVFSRAYGSQEGRDVQWSLNRPFFTLKSRVSYGISLRDAQSITRLLGPSYVLGEYETADRSTRIWCETSHGENMKVRPRLEIGYLKHRGPEKFGENYSILSKSRMYGYLSLTLWQPRYSTDRFVHKLGPVEDIQTGSSLSMRWGYTQGISPNASSFLHLDFNLSPRWHLQNRVYVFSTFHLGIRQTRSRFEHGISLVQLQAYRRFGSNSSLALRLRAEAIHRPDGIRQLPLGLKTGLRGFPVNTWVGNRRIIVNTEIRPTFFQTTWATLGGALFGDLGTAWTAPETPSLHSALGMGLRLGLSRIYNTPVWRLDVARNSRRKWYISLGMGQYF